MIPLVSPYTLDKDIDKAYLCQLSPEKKREASDYMLVDPRHA